MDELRRVGQRHQRQRRAVEATYRELVPLILEARHSGLSLRAIATETGLSFARIHQIEKGAQHG